MGILDQISSATGDKQSNHELVKQCLKTPALLHSVAEGLRTGNPQARLDCVQILNDVGERRAEVMSGFVTDYLDATRSSSKRLARLAFKGLAQIVSANPADVYAEREYLLSVARGTNSLAVPAVSTVAALCADNPNYRGKLLGHLLRLLPAVPDKDLLKWVKAIGPAVEGSSESIKKLSMALQPRRQTLDEATNKKLDRLMTKLERSTIKRKR
jgi:hypothetical protein